MSKKGNLKLEFNQELLVPNFIDQPDNNKQIQGRELVSPSELNVARDLLDIKFITQEESNITFYLTLKSWTSTGMDININFSDPLQVSKGINRDNIVITIKNPDLFISKETMQKLTDDRTTMSM